MSRQRQVHRQGGARTLAHVRVDDRLLRRVGALHAHVLSLARQQVVQLVGHRDVGHHAEPHHTLFARRNAVRARVVVQHVTALACVGQLLRLRGGDVHAAID